MTLARWAQSRREQPPPVWTVCWQGWLQLSRTKTEQWWQALSASHWSRAQALRSMVLTQSALATRLDHVWQLSTNAMGPGELIRALEALIQEGRLSPVQGRRLEESVLQRTDVRGPWQGTV